MWNIFKYSTKLNNSVTLKENLPEICPFFCMPKLQTVLKADLPQNFYVYMYLNIKFFGPIFSLPYDKKMWKSYPKFRAL